MTMFPVMANNTTSPSSVVLIPVIDPFTVMVIVVFGLVFTIFGVVKRGAILSVIAAVMMWLAGLLYAGGFTYYDSSADTVVFYRSQPIGWFFITLGIVNFAVFIYKMVTPVRRHE